VHSCQERLRRKIVKFQISNTNGLGSAKNLWNAPRMRLPWQPTNKRSTPVRSSLCLNGWRLPAPDGNDSSCSLFDDFEQVDREIDVTGGRETFSLPIVLRGLSESIVVKCQNPKVGLATALTCYGGLWVYLGGKFITVILCGVLMHILIVLSVYGVFSTRVRQEVNDRSTGQDINGSW